MSFRIALAAILLNLITASTPFANETINPAVHTVASGGQWETKTQSGFYRVIMTIEGWEHVVTPVTVEWIETPREPGAPYKIVASARPVLPYGGNYSSTGIALKPLSLNHAQLSLDGVNAYGSATREGFDPVSVTVILGLPGEMRVTKVRAR